MPQPTKLNTNLTIEQFDAAYMPALNIGYLSEGMKLLKVMEALRLESLSIEEETAFDDNNYFTAYEVGSVDLDADLLTDDNAITELQRVLCNDYKAQLDEFSERPSIDEMSEYMNAPEFTNEVFSQLDIDYHFVVLLMQNNLGIHRVALASRIQQVIDEDLPQLAQLTTEMAA
ncbi:MAG: hypothetical protein CMF12_08600 [Idiomarina sp.]|uniref:hypothetical protein n=1 Tax=Idiomarina sp. TaxID=1874361 RepID=UPI000C366D39|nr:hypothetical protein [Idiomarina sp.]MBT42569.1 hypothetical protein [Idiomarina sp.]|tara:strand:+ start:940 stop:1458 length:519 start_codon:yes stop_codon:yes gene_type:complete